MINSILFGNGYWANIVKEKIIKLTNLMMVVDSKTDTTHIRWCCANIVFVCSSTSSHYEIVKMCLNNNIKYIFCTKPFTGDYKKAKELYSLAKKKDANIFVDNLFLFRNEILDIPVKDMKYARFIWRKLEGNPKESLWDSYLYHDLYLLEQWSRSNKWKVKSAHVTDNFLWMTIGNGRQRCSFRYKRNSFTEGKWVFLDDLTINLSSPANDPLKECIVNMLQDNIDFDLSKKVTLNTLKTMGRIKKQLRWR